MTLQLQPLHPVFAAEASGVNLKTPLDAATVAAIEAAMTRYAVLVFRGQALTQGEQVVFSRNFGPLNMGLRKATGAKTRFDYDELIDISNVTADGQVAARDSAKLVHTLANQLWHSDSSFQDAPIKYSMLAGVVVPPEGGETEFCDLRAAYDALPDQTKREIATLRTMHSAFHSRFMLGDAQHYGEAQLRVMPPVEKPVVRIHPQSKRKSLLVGSHCTHVVGMTVPEGRLLIAELLEHATQREFVFPHTWRAGDLVIWDNRCTLHRGRRYDPTQRRDLRRTTCEEFSIDSIESVTDAAVAH